jgi:hypothetical protein
LAAALIVMMECVAFNLPFWTTIAASTDSDGVYNAMGPGVSRTADGLLKVTDPTGAYLELAADGSSSYARIDPASVPSESHNANGRNAVLFAARVRLDSDGRAGRSQSVDLSVPQSLYLRTDAKASIRLWLQEPAGSLIAIRAVRANAHVPFQFDWLRVAIMATIMLLIAAWRPGSALWRITLNPHSVRQRLAFALPLLAVTAVAAVGVVARLRAAAPLSFHLPGEYTYDFDQYGHMADALLHGRTWLDLPVPKQLAAAANPYDTTTREQLLAQGVSPIYWDYVFYQGHWFSYFGVLPAVLLFMPYRAISSLWVPGGAMLPTSAAVLVLVAGFIIAGSLLIVRLVRRLAPHASIAATSMALLLVLIGSNVAYLGLRMNFYSVPFAASLLLSALGLWFWIGASDAKHHGRFVWRIGDAPAISLPHLAAGSLCIAANIGCRPTFALIALLGFPLFRQQLAAVWRYARPGAKTGTLRATCAVLVPALLMVVPIGAYNAVRFGSPFIFGDAYQLTVADMTHYAPSAANILSIAGYYLLLPLRATGSFPFLALSPTPLARWAYTEPLVGGLFMLCPVLLLAWALPFLRRRLHASGLWGTLMGCLSLAVVLMLVDAARGGLGWRYMTDFGWLFALAAIAVMLVVLRETDAAVLVFPGISGASGIPSVSSIPDVPNAHETVTLANRNAASYQPRRCRPCSALWFVRLALLALMLASITITLLSFFVPGRDDALIHTYPTLYYSVRSWFMAL